MSSEQTVKNAAVIGCGQMGPGIAYTLGTVGCQVKLYGRTEQGVTQGMAASRKAADVLVEYGCVTKASAEEAVSLVSGTTDLETAVKDADLVIESIAENLPMKQELFAQLESICSQQTILTSNTSGLPATQIAERLSHPGRFAVTHFWNPPHLMLLVEVVQGEKTADETVDLLMDLLENAGKKPVAVRKDTPGQLGNRLFQALLREALHMVNEGIASVEDVDRAVRYGFGRRFPVYGLLEHQDVEGLDTVYAIQSYMGTALCNSERVSPLLEDLAQAGNLGIKTGKGFYDWNQRDPHELLSKRDTFLLELLKAEREKTG